MLGLLAAQDRDVPAARRWLTAAIDAGEPDIEEQARYELGRLLAETGDPAGARQVLTPQPGQDGSGRPRAEEILGELAAAERITGPAPVSPAASTVPLSPRPAPPPLPPLPSALLAALADIAEADGKPAEAQYWRQRLAAARAGQ